MCKQGKTRYEKCEHVHADHSIELCDAAKKNDEEDAKRQKENPDAEEEWDGNNTCRDIKWYWREWKYPGRCMWCRQQEAEDKRHKTWGRGKIHKRPDWLR